MTSRPKTEHHVSAGGVVCRATDGHMEVALCGRLSPPLWALPKGTPDPGESMEQTALREVEEETGLKVSIQAPLGSIHYSFVRTQDDTQCHKTVHFYLMKPVGGDISLHDPEFDLVRWFPQSDVLAAMTHATERDVVRKALDLAREEPATSP